MAEPGLSNGEPMGVIEEVYADLETETSLEDFRAAVEEKVAEMAGLADERTAAMLIAHDLQGGTVVSIGDLSTDLAEAKFIGKVRRIGELRTFERDEGEDGRVINVEVVDETGTVRLAFWDDQAEAIASGDLEVGDILRVKGRPRDGFNGLEVSVDQAETDDEAEIEVDLSMGQRIEDLSLGQAGVRVSGRVLDVDPVRTFDRDDGTEGRVANLVIGDETGRIRITLWDERAADVDQFEPGDHVDIIDGSVRERDGEIECHVGNEGEVVPSDNEVEFIPNATPIASIDEGDVVDLTGIIRSTDPIREFERDDGSTGRVRNVRLQDGTGDVRVAIWGEAVERDLGPGDAIWLGNVEVREGWQEDLEVSVSWQSAMAPIDPAHVDTGESQPDTRTADDGSAQLDSFAEADPGRSSSGESVIFEGTVVQTGDPLIVDDGDEAVRVETDATVTLGQHVRVEGERHEDRIDAESVVPSDGKR